MQGLTAKPELYKEGFWINHPSLSIGTHPAEPSFLHSKPQAYAKPFMNNYRASPDPLKKRLTLDVVRAHSCPYGLIRAVTRRASSSVGHLHVLQGLDFPQYFLLLAALKPKANLSLLSHSHP